MSDRARGVSGAHAARGSSRAHCHGNTGSDASDTRYTQPETPFDLASTGNVELLSFNWLAGQAEAGAVLPRRQELPREVAARGPRMYFGRVVRATSWCSATPISVWIARLVRIQSICILEYCYCNLRCLSTR